MLDRSPSPLLADPIAVETDTFGRGALDVGAYGTAGRDQVALDSTSARRTLVKTRNRQDDQ